VFLEGEYLSPPSIRRSMMFSKVRINKAALNYFRKLARDSYPNEIQAYLIGNVRAIDEIEVTRFAYPTRYEEQSPQGVAWFVEDVDKLRQQAESDGERVIGDCHSHPSWDAVMSGTDYRSSVFGGLLMCGIVSVYGRKTRVRFWNPNSALPCKVIYT
jgi:proteasome lid subunit RPN8/RPN11